MNNLEVGRRGEEQAEAYLRGKGWKMLGSNYKLKFGEIDLIFKDNADEVVFIEVKAVSGIYSSGFLPEDNLSSFKVHKFRRICKVFVAKHSYFFDNSQTWRMDFVSITFLGDKARVRHYINI